MDRIWSDWVNAAEALLAPAGLVLLIGYSLSFIPGAFIVSVIIAIAWNIFGLWRGVCVVRAISKKADLAYDRKGKFKLSADYHDTQSATAASRKKPRK